jgi:hypothetical protein
MMESVHRSHLLGSRFIFDQALIRRMISYAITVVGLGALYHVYFDHWDPLGFLMIGFFIAPLILPFLGLGWDSIRMMLLSSVAVAIAAFFLPYVYLGILTPLAFLRDPEAQFLVMACILAPAFEELAKGTLWILEHGDWKHGAAVGLGFGCFEATSYLMVYGIDVAFLRWQGTILHVIASAMMFQGLSMKQYRWIMGSIGLHILHNSLRILAMR